MDQHYQYSEEIIGARQLQEKFVREHTFFKSVDDYERYQSLSRQLERVNHRLECYAIRKEALKRALRLRECF